jgi:hypothetical protein
MGIQIAPWGNHQFVTNGGAPAAGYQLFVYNGRSIEKVTVYTDVDGVGEHTNPIIIDTNDLPRFRSISIAHAPINLCWPSGRMPTRLRCRSMWWIK